MHRPGWLPGCLFDRRSKQSENARHCRPRGSKVRCPRRKYCLAFVSPWYDQNEMGGPFSKRFVVFLRFAAASDRFEEERPPMCLLVGI